MSTLSTYNLKHPDAAGDQITFTSGGNTGIGTASADTTLRVTKSAVDEPSQANDIAVFERDGSGYLKIYNSTSGVGGIAFGDPDDPFMGAVRYDHTDDNLNFYVNNDERVRIDSSGNLGLGDESPLSRMMIREDTSTTSAADPGTTSSTALSGAIIELVNKSGTTDSGGGIVATGLGTSGRYGAITFVDKTSDNNGTGGEIRFFTSGGKTDALSNNMTLTQNGNLLLGTTSSSGDSLVQVEGPIQTGAVRMASHYGSYTASTSATDLFKVRFTGGHGGAEFTYWFVDSAYPNGVRTGKIYMSFRGSGTNITAVSINAANESSVTGGSFTGITWSASVHDVNHIKLTVTGSNTSGSGTMYIYGVSPFFDTLTPITDI